MAGGGAGLAMGRAILQEPSPADAARQVADIVHGG
jgi:DhnA family fructose-bisphosphate aldolase class Ia